MTVPVQTPEASYAGNGATTEFAVPFRYNASSDLRALVRDADGIEVEKENGLDFTATSGRPDAGGTLTMGVAPVNGETLVIWRETARAQSTDYIESGPFRAESHEDALDKLMLLAQEQDALLARAPKVPRGEVAFAIPGAADRALKFLGFDAFGEPLLLEGTGESDLEYGALEADIQRITEHVYLAAFLGWKQDGTTEDATAIQADIDAISAAGGGVIHLRAGATIKLEAEIIIKPNVWIMFNGATVNSHLHGDSETSFVLMSYTRLIGGTINTYSEFVSEGGSELGTQSAIHGCVRVGPLYGSSGTVASPSALEYAEGWTIDGMTFTSNKDLSGRGAHAIAIYGGARNGVVRNCRAPSSATLYGLVGMDWGFVGSITSDDTLQDTNRAAYDAGTALTTHPVNIMVDNCWVGDLTRPNVGQDTGTHVVRLSGAQGITVRNILCGITTQAPIIIHAGDLGFEFAQESVRKFGMDGSTISNVTALKSQKGNLLLLDSYADNLARAIDDHGYDALTRPLLYSGLKVSQVRGFTSEAGNALDGIRALRLWGAELKDCVAIGFRNNILLDELCREVKVLGGLANFARESNVYIGHGSAPPEDCEVRGINVHSAGRGGGNHAGIFIANSKRIKIFENTFGISGANDPSTIWNIRADGAQMLSGGGNRHLSTSAGGVAESLFSSTEYGKLDVWQIGEMIGSSEINVPYSGVSLLPVARHNDPDLVKRGHFRAAQAALSGDVNPNGGAWVKGDVIDYWAPDAAGYHGVHCTTGGIGGSTAVFKQFGAIAA